MDPLWHARGIKVSHLGNPVAGSFYILGNVHFDGILMNVVLLILIYKLVDNYVLLENINFCY